MSPRDIYLLFLRVLYDLHTLVPRGTSPRDNQLGYSYLQVHSIHTYLEKKECVIYVGMLDMCVLGESVG